eukprot:gb/GEZN01005160.1/.p1 GENE.gb/GEZN01005160.1/~~gb/GEZN01005160.1/.p1  ORF type:complete len:590 (-),score=81.02 gb/GEZN01005160.1/:39-1808(-)
MLGLLRSQGRLAALFQSSALATHRGALAAPSALNSASNTFHRDHPPVTCQVRHFAHRNRVGGNEKAAQKDPKGWTSPQKVLAPPMVYITGEEMTHYAMQLILAQWIKPHVDTTKWEFFDLSCKARDESEDKVLHDAVAAGARIGAIFKEPTITPTTQQAHAMGLKKGWGSPNGAMRKGWNGVTISRDTIHIEGVELGFKRPVLFDRHAVGGEYGAGWAHTGTGRLMTTFFPDDHSLHPVIIDARRLDNASNVAVVYHNPLDNVREMAHHFFGRCLEMKVVPFVVTKKTVFKWQEPFWKTHKDVFDEFYKDQFKAEGLLDTTDGELAHLISDAATMQIIRWTKGGFGMSAHNYDGDMLTDEIAQAHRSPGFITSNLMGVAADGRAIKEFEASHGTVSDLWYAHLVGKPTSLNPLGLAEALMGAMSHSGVLAGHEAKLRVDRYVDCLRRALHATFRAGEGTQDMVGEGQKGKTTEEFIDTVAKRLSQYIARDLDKEQELLEYAGTTFKPKAVFSASMAEAVDRDALLEVFKEFADSSGETEQPTTLTFDQFEQLMVRLGAAPVKNPSRISSAREVSLKDKDSREHIEVPSN